MAGAGKPGIHPLALDGREPGAVVALAGGAVHPGRARAAASRAGGAGLAQLHLRGRAAGGSARVHRHEQHGVLHPGRPPGFHHSGGQQRWDFAQQTVVQGLGREPV